jgi:hypothetical protein
MSSHGEGVSTMVIPNNVITQRWHPQEELALLQRYP